ncbi:hypothetical protein EBME_1103 [bacterium endosymbiont of Mortierella elongata FMR23-6]|nr:hypothetical protein EBME_1103 [bacterium endosymbiont of Mortierella elongata FMR23-6]
MIMQKQPLAILEWDKFAQVSPFLKYFTARRKSILKTKDFFEFDHTSLFPKMSKVG